MSDLARSRAEIVVLIDEWPWPTVSGRQRRTLAVIEAVQHLGLSLVLAALVPPDKDGVTGLHEHGLGNLLAVYPGHWIDAQAARARYWFERLARKPLPLTAPGFGPTGARHWLGRVVDACGARATLVSLARNAWIGSWRGTADRTRRVLDLVDLVTPNGALWGRLNAQLGRRPVDPRAVPREALSADYMGLSEAALDPREPAVATRFDLTMLLSRDEAQLVSSRYPNARVRWTPHEGSVRVVHNGYGSSALLVMGDNPFNLQAYAWLANFVLPRVLAEIPDFELVVAGRGSNAVLPVEGVRLIGDVADLRPLYAEARMTLCPVLAGTGQPTRVPESLAHGVPVVLTRYAGRRSAAAHGVDGFVASDGAESATYVVMLSESPSLARAMGERAPARSLERAANDPLRRALAEVLVA